MINSDQLLVVGDHRGRGACVVQDDQVDLAAEQATVAVDIALPQPVGLLERLAVKNKGPWSGAGGPKGGGWLGPRGCWWLCGCSRPGQAPPPLPRWLRRETRTGRVEASSPAPPSIVMDDQPTPPLCATVALPT